MPYKRMERRNPWAETEEGWEHRPIPVTEIGRGTVVRGHHCLLVSAIRLCGRTRRQAATVRLTCRWQGEKVQSGAKENQECALAGLREARERKKEPRRGWGRGFDLRDGLKKCWGPVKEKGRRGDRGGPGVEEDVHPNTGGKKKPVPSGTLFGSVSHQTRYARLAWDAK